jgi:hypothetical protein
VIITQEILLRLSYKEYEREGELGKNGRETILLKSPV